ncbi:hypothetical protein BJ138DRAFT_1087884 [Hygrophoropsis aurantiaca]|uniref:Uncharacterized protein n=1 Tax=Hygrophoropsis aurantiaca TaxID=72124 RepID=A0ACB8AB58_9AGAM|nr:hypothetical protein BJ138DRAFT_1087884 [Hygrophoropsis aurantiaca]
MEDSAYLALPSNTRRRIDEVFDSYVRSKELPSAPSQIEDSEIVIEGGFIVDDADAGGFLVEDDQPGGFMIEDDSEVQISKDTSHIPLSSIPSALRQLDLPSDDEEILSVFRNAASGWGAHAQDGGVNRKNWRAVCAALLDQGDEGEGDRLMDSDIPTNSKMNSGEEDDTSGPDSDDYHMSASDEPSDLDEGSDEEYESHLASTTSRQKPVKPRRTIASGSSPGVNIDTGKLSTRQKAACREDFARFFPDIPDSHLDQQRIMIKDIMRIAKLLKEKLKAEEIVEMLEAFSTSPDKSVSLSDLENMMITTRLIRT